MFTKHIDYGWAAVVYMIPNEGFMNNGGYTINFMPWTTRDWLNEHIGTKNKYWYYDLSYHKIFFRSEEDKVKFILRWM